jgi:predicted metal-dependent phosphoesterase TrpH
MIDLHLHTYYSDGTLSPKELVHLAKSRGIKTIAITDHDGISGISEGLKAGMEQGVRVIPGIEFSTADDEGAYMHILGYGIDINNNELNKEIQNIRQKRKLRNKKLLQALNDIGCKITKEDLQLRRGQDFIGKPIFAMALVKKGYINTPKEAFEEGKYLRSDAARRVHREKISVEKALRLIHNAGGVAALAHPMKVSRLGETSTEDYFIKLDQLISRLKTLGLKGMECYYSSHTLTEIRAHPLLKY